MCMCVFFSNADVSHIWRLGSALLGLEARMRHYFCVCTTLRSHICNVDICVCEKISRMSVCVGVILWCNVMNDECEGRRGEGETQLTALACSYRKVPREPPGLTFQSEGGISINST